MARINWTPIIERAAVLARSHAASYGPPSLRRVHYMLVSDPLATSLGYGNTLYHSKRLSELSAEARDAGTFPHLVDTTRTIEHADGWSSLSNFATESSILFTLDRSARLPVRLVLLVEKTAVLPIITSRFAWLDCSAVRGYASLSHARKLAALDSYDDRPTLGLYAGDYDATGLDINRALGVRLPYEVKRLALSGAQVAAFGLPPAPGKSRDSRAASMIATEGRSVQVELDALPPEDLLDLYAAAIVAETGVTLDSYGFPVMPDVDEEEAAARARIASLIDPA